MTATATIAELEGDLAARYARIASLEAENAALRAELARLRPPPVPAAVSDLDGPTTISTVKNRIILPTRDELYRLEEMVYRAYPKLKAGGDSNSFRAAFFRLTYTRRAERLDAKRSLDWWVDQAEDWLKAQNYYPSRPADQSFVAACVAMGDIAFSTPAKFPSMSLGLTGLPQFEALPGRWRAMLASGRVPEPIDMPS
jgi:hypothetical protein